MAVSGIELKGRVGNVVYYRVRGKTRIRSLPLQYRDANTPRQQAVRRRLVVAARFYHRLLETPLANMWRAFARGKKNNGYILFMKRNIRVFDDRTLFDPARLRLTEGRLAPLHHESVEACKGTQVTFLSPQWRNVA